MQGKIVERRLLLSMCTAATLLALAAANPALAQSRVPLAAYNVDPSQVSVSGFTNGSSMAMQLAVAYSSRIMGVAAFSGFPYDCRRAGNVTSKDCAGLNTPDISILAANMNRWSGHEIDPVANIARQKIFVYVGKFDSQVSGTVVGQSVELYRQFAPEANIRYVSDVPAQHTFPTDFDSPYFYLCNSGSGLPPMANCGYDGAGEALRWIYGPLNPRTAGLPAGNLIAVDQRAFVPKDRGMDEVAWLYVPKSCEAGMTCRLHIFLHDCGQSYFTRGDTFFANYSGHSRWAETNGIILLFPQTRPDTYVNFDGCWDVDGLYDGQYDQKAGTQTQAIMAMVARITSGFQGTTKAIEYHHAEFDHYFVTTAPEEITKLDTGVFAGWTRTGESFGVLPVDTAGAGNVCRFFSTSFGAKSSHFYTADADECESVKHNSNWQFEGLVFALNAPDAAGNCAAGSQGLYRLYNNGQGGAPNHRYTTSLAIVTAMTSAGWVSEGVRGCASP